MRKKNVYISKFNATHSLGYSVLIYTKISVDDQDIHQVYSNCSAVVEICFNMCYPWLFSIHILCIS